MSYTSQVLVENYLGRALTAREAAQLELTANMIEEFINNEVGTTFDDAPVATTRYYNSGGGQILDIDPCTEITKVALVDNDEADLHVYVLNEDFEGMPRNDTVKTWVEKRTYGFPSGLANIAVTAKFSRGSIPDDI